MPQFDTITKKVHTVTIYAVNLLEKPEARRRLSAGLIFLIIVFTLLVGFSKIFNTRAGGSVPPPATSTWTGSADGNWSNAANWSSGKIPSYGDNLVFPASASNKTSTDDLGDNFMVNSITFNDSGYTLGGPANNALLIGQGQAGITDAVASGGNTISLNLRFDSTANMSTRWVTVTSSAETLTISGMIAGSGGLTKEGLGDLVLSGANTYGGVTKINVGSLIAQNNTALGTIGPASTATSGGTEVVGGADLELRGNISIGREALFLRGYGISNGGALRNLSDNNSFAGQIIIPQTTEIGSDAGALTLTGGVTGTFNLNLDGAGAINFTTAPIGIGGGLLTKNGSGTTTFGFPNTYTGLTTINAGKLQYGCDNAMMAGGITVNGGTLDMSTYSDMQGAITLGNLAGGSGIITGSSGILSGSSYTVYAGTISAIIAGDGSTLTKSTPGTVTLTRPNQFTGAATVSAGVLDIQDSLALGTIDGATTVSAGATLQVDGSGLNVPEYLTISGVGLLNAGAIVNANGSNTISGQITLGAATTIESSGSNTLTIATGGVIGAGLGLTIDGSGNTAFSTGPIATTTGALTKNGPGTLTLSAYNSYTGTTTINAGNLTLNGGGSINLSTVMQINSQGSLTVDDSSAQIDRLADSLALTSDGGAMDFYGSSSAAAMETLGTLTLSSGESTITVHSGSGGATILRYASLSRTAGASALVRGTSLGSTPGANVATLLFSTAPTLTGDDGVAGTPTVSILPGVFGDSNLTGGGTDMVTYGRGNNYGLRLLNGGGFSNEYTTNPAVTNGNVKISTALTALTTQINSLILSPGGSIADAGSAKTITLMSGNILNLATNTTIAGANTTITGGAGAIEFSLLDVGNVNITANLTTTGGLTKSGFGTTTQSLAQNYTGLTAVNQGTFLYGTNNAILSGNLTVDDATVNLATFTDTVGAVVDQNGTISGTTGVLNGTSYSFRSATVSAILAGTGVVTVTNTNTNVDGVTLLSGNSTYSSAVTVSGGILALGATGDGTNGPLGTTAGATTVSAGASLDLNGQNLSTAEPLTINSTGIALMGALINRSPTASPYSGNITLGTAARIGADFGKITINGGISGATLALTVGGFGNVDIPGVIGTTTGTVTKDGFGTYTPSGNNTYTGATTISVGTLKLGGVGDGTNSPLGTTAGITSITAGATFDLNGTTLSTAEPLTINGVGTGTGDFGLGVVINSSGTSVNYPGLLTLGSASTIKASSGAINLTNVSTITGAYGLALGGSGSGSITSIIGTGAGTITKIDPGTWTMAGVNTYTGATTIYQGTIKFGVSDASGGGPLGTAGTGTTIYSGGVIDMNGFSSATLAEALAINGFGINNGGALINNSSGGVTFYGGRTLGSDSRITNSGAGTMTLSGAQAGAFESRFGGAGNITMSGATAATASSLLKDGAGTMILSANNAHTGLTTINAGMIQDGIASGMGAGALLVNGGTFDLASYADSMTAVTLVAGTIDSSGGGILTGTGGYTVESGLISGIITGAYAMNKNTAGLLNITNAETYSGATTINGGTISLNGSGTAVSSAFTINLDGTLTLDNSTTNVASRLGDALVVTMNGGNFNLIGQDSTTVSETIGQLAFVTGHNTVTVDPKAGSGGLGTTLTVANNPGFNRSAGATVLFRGPNLGSTPAAGVASIVFSTAPTLTGGGGAANSKTVSVIKGAYGDNSTTGTGTDMVTYNVGNTTGLRLLNGAGYTTEYQGDLSVAGANVKLTSSTAATANNTNSLILNGYNVTNASVTLPLAAAALSGNVIAGSTNSIAGANTVLGITTYELDVLASGTPSVSATIGTATTGSLVVSGSGNVTLSAAANAYTGTTYINNATLTEGNPSGTVLSTGGVTEVGGTFDTGGNSDSIGAITMTAGTVKSGAGTLTTTGTLTTNANANSSAQIAGTLALPAAATLSIADGLVEDDLVIPATLTSASTSLTKSGNGVVVLSGNNTYTGTTLISAGTVKLGATGSAGNGPLGTTAGLTSVASGAALDLNGYNLANAEPTTINGTGLSANVKGAILNTKSGAVTYGGLLALGAAATVESDYGTISVTNTGTISGATYALTLRGAGNGTLASIVGNTTGGIVKNDLGTWTVSGASTYTGTATITLGVLQLSGTGGDGTNSPLGTITGGTTIASTAMLDLNGLTLSTAEPLTSVSGTGIASAGAIVTNASGSTSFSGPITLGAASQVNNNGSGTFTINGAIAGSFALTTVTAPGTIVQGSASVWSGTGTLTVAGYGITNLAGQNSMTGAMTVSSGRLQVGANGGVTNTPLGTIAGGVTVSAGAVLDLSTYVVGGASTWEPLTLNGTGVNNGGALISSSSSGNSFGALTLASNCRIINSGSGVINITGAVTTAVNLVIGGSGPTTISGLVTTAGIAITKYDAGTLILSNAANANTGLIRVNGGLLQLSGSGSIAATPVTVAGGTFDFNGITKTIGAVTLISGTITDSNVTPGVLTGTGYTFYGGTISGVLGGSAIAIAKSTGALLSISKSISDTGTWTISAGTVQYTASNVIADTSPVTLTGGTIDLQSNSDTVAAVTLTSGSIIGAGTLTGTSYAVASGTVSAILAGAVNLTKTSAGLVTLSGLNTYTGITTISAGTLSANTLKNGTVACSLGAATNAAANLVFNTGTATLQYTGTNDSTDRNITTTAADTVQFDITVPTGSLAVAGATTGTTAPVTKIGPGTLVLTGANQHTGVTSVLAGNLKYGAANAILTGGVTVNNGTYDIASYTDSVGTIILQNGGQIIDSVGGGVLTSTAQFDFRSGQVSAALGSAVAAGLAKTTTDRVILSGNNTFTSTSIAVSAGVLNLQNSNALGASGTALASTITAGAQIELQNNVTIPSTKTITANGTGVNQGGAIDNVADSNTIAGAVTLGATGVRLNSSAGTLTINGAMTGSGYNVTFGGAGTIVYGGAIGTAAGTVTKDGTGTLALSVANSYTGLTAVSAGVVIANNATSFGTVAGGVTVASGAAVQMQNSITVGAEALTLNGTGISGTGALDSTSGTNVWQGNLTLNATSAIGVDANTLAISGSITGGAGIGLSKVGTASLTVGTTTLGGDMTISTGTLVASGSSAIGVTGNWVNSVGSGAFTANSSTVTLSGGAGSTQVITGSTTFYNLSATASSARTINFGPSSVTTVTGTWTCTGAVGQNITLGLNGGVHNTDYWYINPTAKSVNYVSPSDSYNQAGTSINPTVYSDGGHNYNWFPTNNPPSTPTVISQGKTSGANDIAESAWTNVNQPWFGFSITDPDTSDTVKYQIQIDNASDFATPILDYTYSTLSSRGTTFAYQVGQTGGTYAVGSAAMTLPDSTTGYWWRVYGIDNSGVISVSPAYFGTQATMDLKVDATAPGTGTIYDNRNTDAQPSLSDTADNGDGSLTTLSASWGGFSDPTSGIQKYEYSIGTSAGTTGTLGWTNSSTTVYARQGSLSLQTGQNYYFNVRATDNAGNVSPVYSSSGVIVYPSLSYTITPNNINFTALSNGNGWTDSQSVSCTVSTNAANGYGVYGWINDYLRSITYSSDIISDFSGTQGSNSTWPGGTYGFGYTSNRSALLGNGSYYAGYQHAAPGDPVVSNAGPVNGSTGAISNQVSTITNKVAVPSTQTASTYQTTLILTVSANF